MVDTGDLKSPDESRAGSSPASGTIFAWLVSESAFNRGNEPLLCPKNGIVKIYGPSICSATFSRKVLQVLFIHLRIFK